MQAEQLILEFTYCSDADTKQVSDEVKNFIGWKGNVPLELKKRDFTKKKTGDTTELNLKVSHRRRPFHNSYSASNFLSLYETFISYIRKEVSVGEDYVLWDRYKSLLFPWLMRMTVNHKTGRVSADYALATYRADQRHERYQDRPFSRIWIHVEYEVHEGQNRHILDNPHSWVAFAHDDVHPGLWVKAFDKIPNVNQMYMLTMPWISVGFHNADMPQYMDVGLGNIRLATIQNMKLYGASDDFQNALWASVTSGGYDGWITTRLNQDMARFVSVLICGQGVRDLLQYFAPDGFQGASNSKAFYKWMLNAVTEFMGDFKLAPRFPEESLKKYQTNAGNYVNTVIMQYRAFFDSVSAVVNYYDDVNVLNFLPKAPQVQKTNTYIGNYTSLTNSFSYILSDEWFQGFDRPKQWRLLAQAYEKPINDAVTELNDTSKMLKEIKEKGETIEDKIARRQVKTMTQFHDELVKVYNAIKYKPIPIDSNHYKWLLDFGLDVPDSPYRFILPEDSNTIRGWGQQQGHCIGSYADQAVKGFTLLLGVRNKDNEAWLGHLQASPVMDPEELDELIEDYTAPPNYDSTRARYGGRSSFDGSNDGVYISQFYGLRNSPIAQSEKDKCVTHLNGAAKAYREQRQQLQEEKEKAEANG